MNNREKLGVSENISDYSLNNTDITSISQLKRMPEVIEELNWPIELQGKGLTDRINKKMFVEFPEGDVLLSYVTTIHELGHLRQNEINPELEAESNKYLKLLAEEKDAWARGWERFSKSNQDIVDILENKFSENFSDGEIKSFKELYLWVERNALKMVEAQAPLFECGKETTEEERFKMLAESLKKVEISKFLEEYKGYRIDEAINIKEAQAAIKNTVEQIISEQ
ncbi:MAG: hypothetical protein NTY12_02370 [Candidatus Falkowbacteria bacterium]|nr:hypothetical protein [Candidatus Falkowbacteria bacterium]